MGDHDGGAAFAQIAESLLNGALGFGVKRGGRLIQQKDRRVFQECAGDGDALALTARELRAVLANLRLIGVVKGCYEIVRIGGLGGCYNLVVGGALFRVGAGASSFLLPLMLQVGFGLTAAASGALTFTGAIGAVMVRARAAQIVRRIGFRRVLLADVLFGSLLLVLCGVLTAGTPRLLMLLLFTAIGISRSILFTSVNTMAYADVGERDMSYATSFAGTAQQLAMTLGVAVAAQVLHLAALTHGSELPGAGDFRIAFFVIAGISMTSLFVYWRLPPDAGSSVSGYTSRTAGP